MVLAVSFAAAMPEILKRPETSGIDAESLTLDRSIHKRGLNDRNRNKVKKQKKNRWTKKRTCKTKRNMAIMKNIDD